jgi:hypothetical protein
MRQGTSGSQKQDNGRGTAGSGRAPALVNKNSIIEGISPKRE